MSALVSFTMLFTISLAGFSKCKAIKVCKKLIEKTSVSIF